MSPAQLLIVMLGFKAIGLLKTLHSEGAVPLWARAEVKKLLADADKAVEALQ